VSIGSQDRRAAQRLVALVLAGGALAMADAADFSATLDRLWSFDAPAASEHRFRAEAARHPPHSSAALEASTQVARSLGLQRRFADADALLDDIAQELDGAPQRLRVRYLLERGRTRNSAGDKSAAAAWFAAALAAADLDHARGSDFYRIDAMHMLGLAASGDAELQWNRRALSAAAASTDERARRWQGSLLHNLGWALHERGEFAQALESWQRALALREASGNAGDTHLARWTVARGLRSLRRLDEAESIQRALAGEDERGGAPDGYVYEELAEIALARGDEAAAKPWAAKAHALLRDDVDLATGEPARLARLARIGGVSP
jgi:tetratricopeptide (TPR) repeat protein